MLKPTPPSPLARVPLALVPWAAIALCLIGCQSSVRVTPGSVEGTHEHTITTIGPGPVPAPPLHVRIQEVGK